MGRLGAHPHIVTVFDIGEENGQPYLVLPRAGRRRRRGRDREGAGAQAADRAGAARSPSRPARAWSSRTRKGIVHRDLKPGNVWLTEDGRAMIGDFGLAVAVDRVAPDAGRHDGRHRVATCRRSRRWAARSAPRSDLYSLGAMLYEMVCGRPPFVGDESVAIIGQHLNTPPVAPSWHRPDCPPALEALILRLLEKDPAKRPASRHRSARGAGVA